MANSDWWKEVPCHLSPTWNLHNTTEIDFEKLKHQIKVDLKIAPDFMRVESLLYLAFLEVPPTGKSFVRTRMPNRQNALKLIKEAEEYVIEKMKDNKHARNGYSLVITALRMWIYNGQRNKTEATKQEENETRLKLKKQYFDVYLKEKMSGDLKSEAFVKVTLAAALSRLGCFERYEEAKRLFEEALEEYPGNTHWMFGRALMQGRLCRNDKSLVRQPSDLPVEIKKKIEIERQMLQEIRETDPTFAWPIAYLGLCLFNLNKKDEALVCLEDAMNLDKGNTDIALISARIHKWMNDLNRCQLILNSLPESSKTAEVVFQLGLVYNERSKKLAQLSKEETTGNEDGENEQLLRHALEYMEETLDKDSCHLPAAIKVAEINARLGNHDEAKDLYSNLFGREDVQQVPVNQVHVRRSFNAVKQEFEGSEVLDNIHKMLQLFIRNFTTLDNNGEITFDKSVRKDAENFLQDLKQISEEGKERQNLQAMLFLSEIQRGLKKYDEAEKLIRQLIDGNHSIFNMAELRWNLAKCYIGLGDLGKAELEAYTLSKLPPEREFQSDEIYADVYMFRVENKLLANLTISKELKDYSYIIENLQNAIRKGSIKACYLYLTKVEILQENLCSLEETIVQTIAEIEACLERSDHFHEKFDESPDDPIDFIKKAITSNLIHPGQVGKTLPEIIVKRYDSLSNMRAFLRDFEGCYLQLRGSRYSWNKVCQGAAKKILIYVREILDHIIFDYQKKVRTKPGDPEFTKFPVYMDWNKADVNKDVLESKFEGYLKSMFPGYKMPEEMKTFFKELQPMYNRDNLWLAVLCDFTGKTKHTGRDDDCDTHYISLKLAEDITFKKVDLVRKSCYEVEKIVEKLLCFFQVQFYSDNQEMAH